ncbi:MAG: hypothetical protein H6Q36_1497 [Chloroflexi bacterium]|nr:hypothetical protein [Chloroflexota bacterium]
MKIGAMGKRRAGSRALLVAALAAGLLVAACGGERERLNQELTEQLASAGIEAFDVSVWPPRGMVPHTNVELRVEGDEAAAREACSAVERLAVYNGETPYLIRVTYDADRVTECGWGTSSRRPGGASPRGTPTPGRTGSPSIAAPTASPAP